jgi:hypothetical protein
MLFNFAQTTTDAPVQRRVADPVAANVFSDYISDFKDFNWRIPFIRT